MVKHTWQTHPDYSNLKKALGLVKQTARYVNERKREAESQSKVVEIQSSLVGKKREVKLRASNLIKTVAESAT
jgi:hypothetical protein